MSTTKCLIFKGGWPVQERQESDNLSISKKMWHSPATLWSKQHMKQSPERKEKKKVHLVITGGILALICPPEYYKIYPEILKNDLKAVSTSFSVQNNTPHNSIRNLRGRIDSMASPISVIHTCTLYSINRPTYVYILSSPPVSLFPSASNIHFRFLPSLCPQWKVWSQAGWAAMWGRAITFCHPRLPTKTPVCVIKEWMVDLSLYSLTLSWSGPHYAWTGGAMGASAGTAETNVFHGIKD